MIWLNMNSKSKAKAKADLAVVAPTQEDLAWWAAERRRHMRPFLLLAASSWLMIPIIWLLPLHAPRHGWAHAIWMAGFFGTFLSWSMWSASEPKACASEIRGRRLKAALSASHDEVPSIQHDREPIRLNSHRDP